VSGDVECNDPVPVAIHEDDFVVMRDEYSVRVSDETVPPSSDESAGCVEDDDRRIAALEYVTRSWESTAT